MSEQFGQGYVGSSADAAVGSMLEKKRANLFAASEEQKRKIKEESAAYRLKGEGEKFSSSSNSVEMSLAHSTVGLVTKEEWAKRRAAAEAGPSAEEPEAAAEAEPSEKKKKKKKASSTLSFAFDDDEEGGGAVELPVKKKPKPSAEAPAAAAEEAAPAPAVAAPASAAPAAAPSTKLPAGHTCIKFAGASLEVQCEVGSSASIPRSRVVGLRSDTVSLDVKSDGRYENINAALCSFLRTVLGGAAVNCDVIRGHKAPIKTVKVTGVASADEAYHRLAIAKGFK